MAEAPLYAVLLAGGSGTRFWPASRRDRPKQFLPISGGRPMLAETFARLDGLVPPERTLVVTTASQAELVRACLPDLPPENLIAEPTARNTAPCIALAAFEIERREPGAVQAVLPADHVIRPPSAFRATVAAAAREAAGHDVLLTFGIRPTFPATGYGYIRAGERLGEVDGHAIHAVERFVEKPDRERAERFLASGDHYWNAGIFVWSTAAILAAVERHLPEVHAGLAGATGAAGLAAVYPSLPAQPVDVAILERATNVRMVPIDYAWSDVGSWAAVPELYEPDGAGNWSLPAGARLVSVDAEGCLAWAEDGELVALVGVRDLVVVRSGRATLVCPRDRAQDVKRVVDELGASAPDLL